MSTNDAAPDVAGWASRSGDRSRSLRDYWDMQLRFAEAVSRLTGRPLGEAVAVYTNFHRRFGLGVVHGVPDSPEWARYVEPLVEFPSHEARLSWTEAFHRQAADETPPPGERRFGCFACDPPDEAGTLRLHFSNRDTDGDSPLHVGKLARRRAELRDLVSYVGNAFPAALTVRGGSWLYHLEAYRRLFPPDYVASRRPPERTLGFQGYSSWGQFLDHHGRVRPGPRSRFLANLPSLEPHRLGEAFPLPALQVTAPLQSFYGHFGITPPDSP